MKISLTWLRDYAPLDAPVAELVQTLVDAGIEVDRFQRGPEGVVVARVTALEPVPESTKGVRFCDIDLGDRSLRVLTGAPNVSVGDLVPYAPPGTLLPGWDEPLAVRSMFGGKYQSPGMLCSEVELGLGSDADGLMILERGTPGQPIHEVVPVDILFEVDVTTNRPDCLCHLGIARELAAGLGEDLTPPDTSVDPSLVSGVSLDGRVRVDVEANDLCPRFMVRIVEGVKVGPSPDWMQRRLRAVGLRPINNVVDVTNFIAHELGQPLHAFDLDRFVAVGGGEVAHVVVRRARAGEEILCLDQQRRTLSEEDVVVCSGDVAASIAGVMGGADTAVTEATTRVLIEAASWNGPAIRATSKRLALRSDASTLYEKTLSDTLPPLALDRAAALIAETGGHVLDGIVDNWPAPMAQIPPIGIGADRISRLLGCPTDASEAATALVRLGFEVEQQGEELRVMPPHFRRDVTIAEDVVEEVGRALGYDRVPSTLPGRRTTVGRLAPELPPEDRTRDVMVGAGFDEAITWSFISPALAERLQGIGEERRPIPLRNPLSEDWSVMRTSCLPGLATALATNLNRGVDDVWLFEVGRVYWEGERHGPAFGSTADGRDRSLTPLPAEPHVLALAMHTSGADAAAAALRHAQATLRRVCLDLAGGQLDAVQRSLPQLRPGRSGELVYNGTAIGVIGEIDSGPAAALDLRDRVVVAELRLDRLFADRPNHHRFHQPPRFPAVVQDLSVVVDGDIPAGAGLAAVREAGGALLDGAVLYDEFRDEQHLGPGRKAWTFRLTFRAPDRTLRAEEAQGAQDAIVVALRTRCNAKPRT